MLRDVRKNGARRDPPRLLSIGVRFGQVATADNVASGFLTSLHTDQRCVLIGRDFKRLVGLRSNQGFSNSRFHELLKSDRALRRVSNPDGPLHRPRVRFSTTTARASLGLRRLKRIRHPTPQPRRLRGCADRIRSTVCLSYMSGRDMMRVPPRGCVYALYTSVCAMFSPEPLSTVVAPSSPSPRHTGSFCTPPEKNVTVFL